MKNKIGGEMQKQRETEMMTISNSFID